MASLLIVVFIVVFVCSLYLVLIQVLILLPNSHSPTVLTLYILAHLTSYPLEDLPLSLSRSFPLLPSSPCISRPLNPPQGDLRNDMKNQHLNSSSPPAGDLGGALFRSEHFQAPPLYSTDKTENTVRSLCTHHDQHYIPFSSSALRVSGA